MKIAITGGTGFVGRHVAASGWQRALRHEAYVLRHWLSGANEMRTPDERWQPR